MALIGTVPRRCVNLPPGSLGALASSVLRGGVQQGPHVAEFERKFAEWLGVPYVFGAATGRSAFQLALEALDMRKGGEIIVPAFTFPVMPMVAKRMGYKPVFCPVNPETFNAGPKEIEPKLTDNTVGVLATHLFGRPAPIAELAELTRARGIRLMEDAAHACGVRTGGKQIGTFGDAGIFSFAQGKNMPCFGGGAVAISDPEVAERARVILAAAPIPESAALAKEALSIWIKWLLTRPLIFGLTAYQALKLKQRMGQPLMDSAFGDELIAKYTGSNPCISRFANLQGRVGLLQLQHIDAFNEGARRNGRILTSELADVPGVQVQGRRGQARRPARVSAAKRRGRQALGHVGLLDARGLPGSGRRRADAAADGGVGARDLRVPCALRTADAAHRAGHSLLGRRRAVRCARRQRGLRHLSRFRSRASARASRDTARSTAPGPRARSAPGPDRRTSRARR